MMHDCVILCGGKGTRLTPVTGDQLPKSLVKVAGRELISYTLDLISPTFVRSVIFAIDHLSDQIECFVRSARLPYPISFSRQDQPGVLDAVTCAARVSGRDAILFLHADEVRPGLQLEEALKFHYHHNSVATVVSTYAPKLHRHWIVEYDELALDVVGLRIQPDEYRLDEDRRGVVLAGAFILDQAAIHYLDREVSIDYFGIVKPLIDAGLLKVFISETAALFNVGTPQELAEADAYMRHDPQRDRAV